MAGLPPGEEIDRDPWLKYWLGMCRLPVDPAASRQAFEGAFQLFDARGEDAGRVHAWCGVVESVLYEWSDFTLLDPWIDRLGDIWGAAQALQDAEVEARVAFGIHGALMFRRPHHPEMAAWAERALTLANRTKNISQRVVASSHVAHYFYWIGDLARASAIVGALDRAPQLRDAAPMTRLNLKMTNAIEYWHRGETDRCVEQVSDGLKEARATGVHLWDCALLAQSVYGTLSAGRLGEGRACLQKMGAVLQERRRLDVSHHHYLTAWEAILQGDTAAARRHLEMAFSLLTALGAIFPLALRSPANPYTIRIPSSHLLARCSHHPSKAPTLASRLPFSHAAASVARRPDTGRWLRRLPSACLEVPHPARISTGPGGRGAR